MEDINSESLKNKLLTDLREIAKQLNISGVSRLKKEELIKRILEVLSMRNTESSISDEVIDIERVKEKTEGKSEVEELEKVKEMEELGKIEKEKVRKVEESEKIEVVEKIEEAERKLRIEEKAYEEKMKGILDILADGYGFLRTRGYLSGSNDIYVSQSQIRRFRLRQGDEVYGQVRPPKEKEKYNALLRIEQVNGADPELIRKRKPFEMLTPIYPIDRLRLETRHGGITPRIIDLIAPIGKGQRGLIVSPPKFALVKAPRSPS